jgi:hypothetical protein
VDPLRRQLFLVVHDPFSGRPVIRPSSVGCGLITAVIAELLLDGRVREADEVTPQVLAEAVLGPAAAPARAEELPALAQRTTARGLVADGVVRQESSRSLLGRARVRYPAVDLVRAVRPRRHLERLLASRRPPGAAEAVLVGLLDALGAGGALELDGGATALRVRAGAITAELPAQLRDLLAGLARSEAGATRR